MLRYVPDVLIKYNQIITRYQIMRATVTYRWAALAEDLRDVRRERNT